MTTSSNTQTRPSCPDPVTASARHVYDAECALHAAHQSHVDEWVTAASNRLHIALVEHLAAEASSPRCQGDQ